MSAAGIAIRPGARRREPEHRRTRQPVHAGSRFNDGPLNPVVSLAHRRWRVLALKTIARQGKHKGKRRGHAGNLGLYGPEIAECLLRFADDHDGRVDPAKQWIASAVGCCVDTVGRVLGELREMGFLTWINRCVPKPDAAPGTRGPQVEQITNWYVLLLPPMVQRLVEAMERNKLRRSRDGAMEQDRAERDAYRDACEADALAAEAAARDQARKARVLKGIGAKLAEREIVLAG